MEGLYSPVAYPEKIKGTAESNNVSKTKRGCTKCSLCKSNFYPGASPGIIPAVLYSGDPNSLSNDVRTHVLFEANFDGQHWLCSWSVFTSRDREKPIIRVIDREMPVGVLNWYEASELLRQLGLYRLYRHTSYRLIHTDDCLCPACMHSHGCQCACCGHLWDCMFEPNPIGSYLDDAKLSPIMEDFMWQSSIVPAGEGNEGTSGVLAQAGAEIMQGIQQAVVDAASNAVSGTVENLRNLASGRASDAIQAARGAVSDAYNSPGFSRLDYGKEGKERWLRSRRATPIQNTEGGSASNNPGGVYASQDLDDMQQTLVRWFLANSGSAAFTNAAETGRDMLESYQPNTELEQTLSRPRKIITYAYSDASVANNTTEYDVWRDHILGNSYLINKLEGFNFIRATLNIKLVLTSSPFLYGGVLVTYRPFSTGKSLPNTVGGLLLRSQRRNIIIYPQTSAGGLLQVPFFYARKMASTRTLSVDTSAGLGNLGTLSLTPLMPLASANGVGSVSCDIDVYTWFSDVTVGGATSHAVFQSLETVGGEQTVLSMHPEIDAHSELNTRVSPMGLNTSVVGTNAEQDEYNLSELYAKESLLTTVDWTSSDARDKHLVRVDAMPRHQRYLAQTRCDVFYNTVHSHFGNMFQYWRGDFIVRIKILCSQYHRGRLRLTFDPREPMATPPNQVRSVTHFVDLGASDEVEINVPFMSDKAWLPVWSQANAAVFGGGGFNTSATTSYNTEYSAGSMQVWVDQPLSGPAATSTVKLLVFIRAAPNFRYGRLREFPPNYGYTPAYTDNAIPTSTAGTGYNWQSKLVLMNGALIDNSSTISYTGADCPTTISTLIRRKVPYMRRSRQTEASTGYHEVETLINGMPQSPGWTNSTYASALRKWNTRATAPQNPQPYMDVIMTPLAYLTPLFCGYKGDIEWTFIPQAGSGTTSLKHYLQRVNLANFEEYLWSYAANKESDLLYTQAGDTGLMGIVSKSILEPLSLVSPYMSSVFFETSDPRYKTGRPSDDSDIRGLKHTVLVDAYAPTSTTVVVNIWYAASKNFKFVEFLNVPPLCRYTGDGVPGVIPE